MNSKHIKKTKNGFTIIEMMIAIAIFLVVVIFGMQALLNANSIHRKSQDMRSIMDSLTFALDDMSKNIRVGYDYHCIENESDFGTITSTNPRKSCKDGFGISFEESDGDLGYTKDQLAYFIGGKSLFRSRGPSYNQGVDDVRLISEEIELDENASGFSVLGAESPEEGDKQQPLVVIRLVGEIKRNNTSTPFSIETAVSQRQIDIVSLGDIDNVLLPAGSLEVQEVAEVAAQVTETTAQAAEEASRSIKIIP